jgi:deoxyribose-phosphate aldolase
MTIELAEIAPGDGASWTAPRVNGSVVRVASVDAVTLEARSGALAARSLKRDAKLRALDLAVRCTDLTTLEGADTPGKVLAMCAKAIRPDSADEGVPSVAAVCVYPLMVPVAAKRLRGTGVKVASVAGSFPSGLGPIEGRLAEIRAAVALGADEVDIVLNRSAFLSGRYRQAFEEIEASKDACGPAHLKVILETGELGSYDQIRKASALAMIAGADFIKTSTGKISPAATHPVALCMAEAIRDFHRQTGRPVGLKVAGGIRTAKQAWQYLVIVHETLGRSWLTPELVRIGASTVLNDMLMQIRKERTGRYQSPDHFTID